MQQYPDSNRIKLLTENEISSLYDRPALSTNQRKTVFVFDNDTIETMEKMSHKNRCYQLLQMGYFSVT